MTYPRFEAFTLFLQAAGRARLTRLWPLLVTLALPVCVAMLDAQPPQVATVGLTPGWATFGQALPQGAATNGLQVGNLATQTDVKNTWPDGSIRFAIVTVNATTAGNFSCDACGAFRGRPRSRGSDRGRGPDHRRRCLHRNAAAGARKRSVAVRAVGLRRPIDCRPCVSAGRGAHPFLRVIFDTRVYNDGGGRVDVSVENTLDIAGAATVTYDVGDHGQRRAGLHAGGGRSIST